MEFLGKMGVWSEEINGKEKHTMGSDRWRCGNIGTNVALSTMDIHTYKNSNEI